MSFESEELRTQQTNAMEFAAPVNAEAPVIVDADAAVRTGPPFVEADIHTEDHLAPDTESDILYTGDSPSLISKETLGALARQFSPLLVPIPFALLIFLFTLPATLQGPPAHPSSLVMGVLLLAATILQGTLLYVAGASDVFWLLSVVGGYVLFVALGVGAVFGWVPALATLLVLLVLSILPVRRGIHATKEGYVDLVESFGRYTHTLYPGLNLLMPWEKVTDRLSIQEITWTCPEQKVSLSREQIVRLTATISYHLWPADAHLAAHTVQDWEQSLRVLFVGTLQSVVNALTPADFVSWSQSVYLPAKDETSAFNPTAATRWDKINDALSRRVQDQVAAWGVQVNWVRIQEPMILPYTSDEHKAPVTRMATQVSEPEPVIAPPPVPEKPPEKIPTAAPAPLASPLPKALGSKAVKVEVLVDAYNAVREGTIADPVTILEIAQRFEQLANDAEASKLLDFDAARAANTLRQRAQKYQERAKGSTT